MNNDEELSSSIMAIRYKIVFVGDICVGKTSIMNRFISNEFHEEYDVNIFFNFNTTLIFQATIGVDFATKMIEFRNNSIKLQIWDSAGQERYKALIPSYVRGAAIIFIIYDLSDNNSFANLESWINFIKQVNTDESLLILCGNKCDLQRRITYKEGYELAQKNNMLFFETSAKTGENVNLMMYTAISKLQFFSQFDMDKNILIQELQKNNSQVEEKPKEPVMNVKDKEGNVKPTVITIKRKKRSCACQSCYIYIF